MVPCNYNYTSFCNPKNKENSLYSWKLSCNLIFRKLNLICNSYCSKWGGWMSIASHERLVIGQKEIATFLFVGRHKGETKPWNDAAGSARGSLFAFVNLVCIMGQWKCDPRGFFWAGIGCLNLRSIHTRASKEGRCMSTYSTKIIRAQRR